jgi:hypothetical protein
MLCSRGVRIVGVSNCSFQLFRQLSRSYKIARVSRGMAQFSRIWAGFVDLFSVVTNSWSSEYK